MSRHCATVGCPARRKAREISGNLAKNGRLAVVQNWRSLAGGNIQFAIRHFVIPE